MSSFMQIGEVAERTRLSLRTIRYYEEAGLVIPATRSAGGFRLYTNDDVDRLLLLRQAKPLGFSLEDLRELLAVLDGLDRAAESSPDRDALLDRLGMFREAARVRVQALREELEKAEIFAELLQTSTSTGTGSPRRGTGR